MLDKEQIKKLRKLKEKHPMPEQTPQERVKNFDEVPFGYDAETAMKEAARCLQCKEAKCVEGCPVEVDIPAFIKLIVEGKFDEGIKKLKGKTTCRRFADVFVHRKPMRSSFVRGKSRACSYWAVGTFLADYELAKGVETPKPEPTGSASLLSVQVRPG